MCGPVVPLVCMKVWKGRIIMMPQLGKVLALFAVLFVLASRRGFLRKDCAVDSMARSAFGSIRRPGRLHRMRNIVRPADLIGPAAAAEPKRWSTERSGPKLQTPSKEHHNCAHLIPKPALLQPSQAYSSKISVA